MIYPWIKAFHIIFMVAWFAGLFYIFRLFVYHVKHKGEANMAAAYSVMERRLLYIIMHPAMFFTFLFGFLLLAMNPAPFLERWFHWKLVGAFLLVGYQLLAGYTFRRFQKGEYWLSEKACRIINEIPTVLLIAIVILVIVRPV